MKTQRRMARVGIVVVIVVSTCAPSAFGQDCPEQIRSWGIGQPWVIGDPRMMEGFGPYAYVVSYWTGRVPKSWGSTISIIDVSDPEGPLVVSHVGDYSTGGNDMDVTDLGLADGRLFFINHRFRVDFVDLSDPSNPDRIRGYYPIGGYPHEFAMSEIETSGDFLYIASTGGLTIVDVSDIDNPTEIGFYESSWEPSDLAVEGGFAYVTEPESGLKIINVSNPANPVEIGAWVTTWVAHDLAVSDGLAFVADGASGVRVIDATTPTDPIEVGGLGTPYEALNVSVDGPLATVAVTSPGVLVVDVSDPANPKTESMIETIGPAEDVAVTGITSFVLEGKTRLSDVGGFHVLDISDPESPAQLSSFEFHSSAMDVAVSRGVKYVARGDSGIHVLDESNSEERIWGDLDTPGFSLGVTPHNGYALVADDHKGLRIIDVTDPANLVEVGFVDTPGRARQVVVADDYAYVADGEGGLRIIDISIPEVPIEVGAVATPDPVVDVAVEGDFAYVADGHLRIIDVSDRAHPVWVGLKLQIPAYALAIKEEVLYLANSSVSVYSLSYPEYPLLLASGGQIKDVPTDITLAGHHAYVATRTLHYGVVTGPAFGESAGVDIFEMKDQYFPSWVGRWEESRGNYWAVAVSDGRIYLAGGESKVIVLDNRCLSTSWVGIVTHDSGFNGSQWRSDVFISHEAESSVGFDFVLHTVDGEFTAEASIEAGHQGVFEDIVGLLGYRGTGALEIRAADPMKITSRVYSESDPGTYGAFLQANRSSDSPGSGRLNGLRQVEGEFRTNISVTNTTDDNREVWITLFRTDGLELVRYPVGIEAGMVVQDIQPFKNRAGEPNLGWGYATVEGEKGILACASVIDSRTNDALIVPLTR